MAGASKIEWTDATVNFWWGCTKVGPGCDHCYAEAWDKRAGGGHWGLNIPRRKIASAVALIHRLDNAYADWAADVECAAGNSRAFGLPVPVQGHRRRVFIQSMSDLFDLEVPLDWFAGAWEHTESCNRLDIQIVTKRVSAVEKRLAAIGRKMWPRHAGLIITVVNQAEADRDIPRLLELKKKLSIPWVGLSIEPLLGPVSLRWAKWDDWTDGKGEQRATVDHLDGARRLDWVIVGGESGSRARPMHPQWARDLRDECAEAGVPFFFKQWGEWADADDWPSEICEEADLTGRYDGNSIRVGKKRAGRLLDGKEHNEFPAPAARSQAA